MRKPRFTEAQQAFLDGLTPGDEWTSCEAKLFATATSLKRRGIVELKFDYSGKGSTETRWGFKARRLPEQV